MSAIFERKILTCCPTVLGLGSTSVMDASLKSAFLENKFFLVLIESAKNNFRLGFIRPPPALLDYPSDFLSNKGALFYNQRAVFQEQFDSILTILNKQFIDFHNIFRAFILLSMVHNEVYDIKCER